MIDERAKNEAFPKVKPPEELAEVCADLKVQGRRELFSLLKFRHKYQHVMDGERRR